MGRHKVSYRYSVCRYRLELRFPRNRRDPGSATEVRFRSKRRLKGIFLTRSSGQYIYFEFFEKKISLLRLKQMYPFLIYEIFITDIKETTYYLTFS